MPIIAPPGTFFRLSSPKVVLVTLPWRHRAPHQPQKPSSGLRCSTKQKDDARWPTGSATRVTAVFPHNREFWFLWKQRSQELHCWLTFSLWHTLQIQILFRNPFTQIQVIVPTFIFNESHHFFFRLFLWCALQHIYNLSQLHVIRKLNKYSPYRIIQIIMKTKILNRNAIRTDLFQAAPRTLSCMFLKMKDW